MHKCFSILVHLRLPSRPKLTNVLIPRVQADVEGEVIAVIKMQLSVTVNRSTCTLYETLSLLVDLVFSISTSSAVSERAWGIRDHSHSKKRNCLKAANVDMLSYIYINV
ncbi:unnamed protein product [Phytophthora fragariaefolia]|uniref:Unnamed protein product n=1 Tax=Phytophthora fragariaefolia TaxID=1490495 RepID=A0A9W7D042_9STRA|nr:unnamed protein product [Phytophthora fragariaefolia]